MFSISVPPKDIFALPHKCPNHELAKVIFAALLFATAPPATAFVLNLIFTLNPDWLEAKFENLVLSEKWKFTSVFWFKLIAVLPTAGLIFIRFSFIVESSIDKLFHNL